MTGSEVRTGPEPDHFEPVRRGPVQGSTKLLNLNHGPVQGAHILGKNWTEPNFGSTRLAQAPLYLPLEFDV